MTRRAARGVVVLLVAATTVLMVTDLANARPGGGQSYGGGSSPGRSGGGSSGGSSKLPDFSSKPNSSKPSSTPSTPSTPSYSSPSSSPYSGPYIPPTREEIEARERKERAYKAEKRTNAIISSIVVVLVISGLLYLVHLLSRKRYGTTWSTATAPARRPGTDVGALRTIDEDFSVVLFEDFLGALITEAHMHRGSGTLDRLATWLTSPVRGSLTVRTRGPVEAVVIGAIRFVACEVLTKIEIVAEVELCFTETNRGGIKHAYWVTERWTLQRAPGVRSRPPERVRVFACPGCGASLDKIVGGICAHCDRGVDSNDHDWRVVAVELLASEVRGPVLTGYAPEQGTDLPTVFDADFNSGLLALRTSDPGFDLAALEKRATLVFRTMQEAWTSLQWERARPFLSDHLFQAQKYWIDAYRQSGLRNVTERARVLSIDAVRLTQDRWYDALTVRVHATGLDYTIRDADQAVVGGDRKNERRYSEYWTFIRGRGTSKKALDRPECPSCGAALAVSMAARCKHCDAKVNSGEFDWVLARIEQDEAYAG